MTCPTPYKKSYETFAAAGFFARADGLRPYRCPCGKFHLSSKAKKGWRMGVSRVAA